MLPTTLFRTLGISAFCLFCLSSTAQFLDWSPVPFGQTSYFKDAASGEILSMNCDWYTPGGVGEFFEIGRVQLEAEFDSCVYELWIADWQPNPQADFRGYVHHPSEVSVQGKNWLHSFPLNVAIGSWHFSGGNELIQYVSQTQVSVLGTMDSVKTFDVYKHDSTTLIGSVSLSQHFGLTSFVPFKVLDGESQDSTLTWELVGFKNDSQAVGFALPEKPDYFPYAIGDRIVLKHSGLRNNGPNVWEPFADLLHIEILGVDTTLLSISGVAARYDSMGFYVESDSNFVFSFTMLKEALDHPYSLPHVAVLNPAQPYFATIPSFPAWSDNGGDVVVSVGGYERNVCDSNQVDDGLSLYQDYSAAYGFVYSFSSSIGSPPETYELYAADGENFSFGVWPIWLSTGEEPEMAAIKVYPNPAEDVVYLSINQGTMAQLTVWNVAGALVKQVKVSSGPVNVSELLPGIYFFQVSTLDGSPSTHRVIIH